MGAGSPTGALGTAGSAGAASSGASTAGGFHSSLGEVVLDLFHLLLHARSLFHQFAEAGHG